MSRSRRPSQPPTRAAPGLALGLGLALPILVGATRFTESRLLDLSAWELEDPDPVGRFRRMREAITGDPDEAKARWARMMKARRIALGPEEAAEDGLPRFELGAAVAPVSLLEPAWQAALGANLSRVDELVQMGPLGGASVLPPPSGLGRSRAAAPGPGGDLRAGPEVRLLLTAAEGTRWEACKEVLRRLGSAYIARDATAFLEAFSRDLLQDRTILGNAVQEDFQQEGDRNLDLELLDFRSSFDTIQARLRWNRVVVPQGGGAPLVTQGTSQVLFDRHHGYRIKGWVGFPFFGTQDPEWVKQAQGGQPNYEEEGVVGSLLPGTGNLPLLTAVAVIPNGDDRFLIDLETGLSRSSNGPLPPLPGEDLVVRLTFSAPSVQIAQTQPGVPNVAICPPTVVGLDDIVDVTPSRFTFAADPLFFAGIRTVEGNLVAVEVTLVFDAATFTHTFTLFYRLQPAPPLSLTGTETCI